ncbi:MAG: crossover junction endodeoxyribonuclease RuvC [Planctomycetota bacterium]
MKVVGIDPGLRLTGYACVELRPGAMEPALLEAGVIRLKAQEPVVRRLRTLHEELGALLDELRPDRLAVEEVFAHVAHVRTAIVMGHGRGVVLLAAALRDLPLDEFAPAEVKKALTGRGQASKVQMQRAVMHQFGLRSVPEPPDVADAIAIAACSARRHADLRSLVPDMPAPRRGRSRKGRG